MNKKGKEITASAAAALPPHKHVWLLIALAFITLFTYSGAMENGFVWDDEVYVTDEKMADAHGLWQFWTNPKSTEHPYYPLTHTSLWLEYQLWGDSPAGYHFTNVILQILNAFLIYFILMVLDVPAAWLCAVIFAIHPVNVESVAWISERKNLLAGLFYFGSFYYFIKYYFAENKLESPARYYYFAITLFILSMLSKTAFCTLPLSLLLIIWWKNEKVDKNDFVALTPFFIVAFVLGLITIWLEIYHVGAKGADFNLAPVDRVLIAGRALWFYAGKVVWPANLMFIYPRWEINADLWWQYLFPVGGLLAVSLLWLEQKRVSRGALACVLFFIVNLLPALGFINFYMMIFSFVGDHLQYISCLGIIVLFVGVAHFVWKKMLGGNQIAAYIFGSAVILLLSTISWQQIKNYKDERTFYGRIIKTNPLCWMAYNNRGRLLEKNGEYDSALADYEQAITVNPNCQDGKGNYSCMRSYNNRGVSFQYLGNFEAAIIDFNRALEMNPSFMKAYLNRGAVYFQQQEFDKALDDFSKAIKSNPHYTKAYLNRGLVYMQKGLMDQALLDFSKTVEIDPEYIKGYINRGIIFMQQGRLDEALEDFNNVIEIDPQYVNAYYNRGVLYMSANKLNAARQDFMTIKALGGQVDPELIKRTQFPLTEQEISEDMVFPIQ